MLGIRSRRFLLKLFFPVALAGLMAIALLPAGIADPPDPATIPLPELDVADPAKSVVARISFSSRTTASVDRAFVSLERAHTHVGDPPILRLRLADPDGNIIDQMNAWSPLWVFSYGPNERLEIQRAGSGVFVVPFSPDLSSMTIRDIALARDILTVDLEPAIHDFCVADALDPDCLEADLSVDSVAPTVPLFAVMGEPASISVTSVVSNQGPDGPVDAVVTRIVNADPGLTVTPSAPETSTEVAVANGSTRTLTKSYSVTCSTPGQSTLEFTTAIEPRLATVVDPDAMDNSRTIRADLDCAVPVAINILPGSPTNPVSRTGDTLPIAILTTRAGEYGNPLAFDARTIDGATLRFGSKAMLSANLGVPESHGRIHLEDALELDEVTRDGDVDALTHFRPRITSLWLTDTQACVFGRFESSSGLLSFVGCDAVRVIR